MLRKKLSVLKLIILGVFVISICFVVQFPYKVVYAQGTFPGSARYTVQSGDTLYLIASRNGISLNVLRVVNGLNTDMLVPGQILNVPINTGSTFSRYTILPGDTLYTISGKFGVSVSNIMAANNISTNMIVSGQVLTIPYLQQKPLATILSNKDIDLPSAKLDIVVDKSDHTLMLFSNGTWLKTYHVELGSGGLGYKQTNGDKKTPEGDYYICEDSIFSPADQYLGTRWMRLSYPNSADAARGLSAGMIDWNTYNSIVTAINNGVIPPQNTALGEGVGIHGGSSPVAGSDWTWGCVGLTSTDVQEFFNYVGIGTRVYIQR